MSVSPTGLKIPLWWERAIAVALLALYWVMSVSAIRHKSATFDEPIHLRAGYAAWSTGDYRIDPENGTLPSRWAAIPLLFSEVRFPETHGADNNFATMLFRARMNMALIGVSLGATVFLIARQIWGSIGGLISLALFTFSPAMLAQGCLVTSDVTTALFFTLTTWTFWRLLHRISLTTVAAAALAFAGLALSKMSAGVFIPIATVITVARLAGGRPLEIANRPPITSRSRQFGAILCAFAACGLVAWLTIWAVYGFRYSMVNPEYHAVSVESRWAAVLNDPSHILKSMPTLRSLKVLPEAYLFGFSYTLHHSAARTSFLFGEISAGGHLGFFPLVVLIKTPIPILALVAIAIIIVVQACFQKSNELERSNFYDLLPLAVLCLSYAAVAIVSRFNIGERHLFPAYPPLFILAGSSALWMASGHKFHRLAVVLLLCWVAVESLLIRPHYLAYFNEFVGGPHNGYRCLVDSSLDWGQDLPALHDWLEAHQCNHPDHTYVDYFGAASLDDYSIHATRLGRYRTDPLPTLARGTYCISATALQCTFPPVIGKWTRAHEEECQTLARDFYRGLPAPANSLVTAQAAHFSDLREARLWAFLRHRQPDEEIACSILVYRLTDEDIDRALHGPAVELD